MRFILVASILASSLILSTAQGQQGKERYAPNEIAMLPDYCQDLMTDYGKARRKWASVLGPTVDHTHHYCRGLIKMMRAQRLFSVPAQHRRTYWSSAVNEISYTIRNATPDFVLLPELYYKRGISQSNAGKVKEAEADFLRAIQILPTYDIAYVQLAGLYRQYGRVDRASEVVSKGLEHVPESKVLRDLQSELQRSNAATKASRRTEPPSVGATPIETPADGGQTGEATPQSK